jgi:hypothetical protein
MNTDKLLTHNAEKPKPVRPRTTPASSTTRLLNRKVSVVAFSGSEKKGVMFIFVLGARPPEFV